MYQALSMSANPNVTSLFMQIKQNFLTARELEKFQEYYEGVSKGMGLDSVEYQYLEALRDVSVERYRAMSSSSSGKVFLDDFGHRYNQDA